MEDLIKINTHERLYIFSINDVSYIKAEGSYAIFHLSNGDIIKTSQSFSKFKKYSTIPYFTIMNRSFIVNIKEILTIKKNGLKEKSIIFFKNEMKIEVSYKIMCSMLKFINNLIS